MTVGFPIFRTFTFTACIIIIINSWAFQTILDFATLLHNASIVRVSYRIFAGELCVAHHLGGTRRTFHTLWLFLGVLPPPPPKNDLYTVLYTIPPSLPRDLLALQVEGRKYTSNWS